MAGHLVRGLPIGAAVCLAVAGYPLWWQFFGPQGYHNLEHGSVGNDLAAITAFASDSLAGDPSVAGRLAINPTEENAFFGWPLVVLVVVIGIWLWRLAATRALVVTAAVMTVLSLGSPLRVAGTDTGIPGLWSLISTLPLYESVIESRFALGAVPAIGVLLALACDRVVAASPVSAPSLPAPPLPGTAPDAPGPGVSVTGAAEAVSPRLLWFGPLIAVLLPIAPTPLNVTDRAPTPAFFATDAWRDHVGEGRTVVTVPLPNPDFAKALHWQVEAGLGFALAEGYFLGPAGPDRQGTYGAVRRPTSTLLSEVGNTGEIPEITDADREAAAEDLRYWRADAVVLPAHPRQGELRDTLDSLLGRQGRHIADVWVWDVRDA